MKQLPGHDPGLISPSRRRAARPVRRLLDLTGLIGVFPVHASVDEAVRAAGGSRLVVTAGLTSAGCRPVVIP